MSEFFLSLSACSGLAGLLWLLVKPELSSIGGYILVFTAVVGLIGLGLGTFGL